MDGGPHVWGSEERTKLRFTNMEVIAWVLAGFPKKICTVRTEPYRQLEAKQGRGGEVHQGGGKQGSMASRRKLFRQ